MYGIMFKLPEFKSRPFFFLQFYFFAFQLAPYAIMQTKNTLLQLVQWHFLAHDQGEKDISDNKDWREEEVSVKVIVNNTC